MSIWTIRSDALGEIRIARKRMSTECCLEQRPHVFVGIQFGSVGGSSCATSFRPHSFR